MMFPNKVFTAELQESNIDMTYSNKESYYKLTRTAYGNTFSDD